MAILCRAFGRCVCVCLLGAGRGGGSRKLIGLIKQSEIYFACIYFRECQR